jgi:hypothetical protein
LSNKDSYFTLTVTFAWLVAVPTVNKMGAAPDGALEGMIASTSITPATFPGADPA